MGQNILQDLMVSQRINNTKEKHQNKTAEKHVKNFSELGLVIHTCICGSAQKETGLVGKTLYKHNTNKNV